MHEFQNAPCVSRCEANTLTLISLYIPIRALGGQVHCQMSSDILKGIFFQSARSQE